MILRSITKHVRDQNWFAVGIDFLIVVVGVFIGIQVANWNAERQLAAQERAYLVQLRDEILVNHRVVDLRMRYNGEVVAAGERALAYLDSDGDCGSICSSGWARTSWPSGPSPACACAARLPCEQYTPRSGRPFRKTAPTLRSLKRSRTGGDEGSSRRRITHFSSGVLPCLT